jgi:meso-butanediol dehydrogenase / (S,S)-butanediol dehydrogenase / diacetyl reductase
MVGSDERRALVTGGASGFGLEIATRLRGTGAKVAIADIDANALEAAAARLGDDVPALCGDVRSVPSVRDFVDRSAAALGGLDTLVHSAGVIRMRPVDDVSEEEWDLVLDVNLKGAFLSCQAALPYLRQSGRGRVVMLGSDAGRRGFASIQAYCASKFGLIGLTESLASELAPDRITVNCVCPVACVETEMGRQVLAWKAETTERPEEEIASLAACGNPLGRNATQADVANAVLYLVSEGASFVTGIALDVDGGAHLGVLPAT